MQQPGQKTARRGFALLVFGILEVLNAAGEMNLPGAHREFADLDFLAADGQVPHRRLQSGAALVAADHPGYTGDRQAGAVLHGQGMGAGRQCSLLLADGF